MTSPKTATTLDELLDQIGEAEEKSDRITLDATLDAIGRRSFGPILLLAGLLTLAPVIGDIPGVPTLMAIFVLLIAGQLVAGRTSFWIPKWLRSRSVAAKHFKKANSWMRKPARAVDKILRPRLQALTNGAGTYAIAIACVIIALAMPFMEVIPFSANGAGLALSAFGLALIANDGLIAAIAFVASASTFWLLANYFLF